MQVNYQIIKNSLSKYGSIQVDIAIEEMAELIKEIIKSKRNKGNKANMTAELADVFITLEYVIEYYNINKNEIQSIIDIKLDRFNEEKLKII